MLKKKYIFLLSLFLLFSYRILSSGVSCMTLEMYVSKHKLVTKTRNRCNNILCIHYIITYYNVHPVTVYYLYLLTHLTLHKKRNDLCVYQKTFCIEILL